MFRVPRSHNSHHDRQFLGRVTSYLSINFKVSSYLQIRDMSACASIELQQPLGGDCPLGGDGVTTSSQQAITGSEEATTSRTDLTAKTLTSQSNDSLTNVGDDADMYRCFSYSSVTMIDAEQGQENLLEPPAWKPPEQEEIEYTDAWNNAHPNNQSHFLQPFAAKDDSTIGSNQTSNTNSNSIFALCGNSLSSQGGGLRPRGFSLHSMNDSIDLLPPQPSHHRYPSIPGSSKPPQHGHHRQSSLPKDIFSSQPTASHPLLPPAIVSTQSTNQQKTSSRHEHENSNKPKPTDQSMKLLQSSTQHTPYEVNSSHHTSQVLADAALAGLTGTLVDLYTVDRSVDTASTTMLATQHNDRERKTALGTLHDVQCILDMYRVDKIADRFKVDLQMPLFVEEEAWVHDVYKALRKTDVEMERYAKKMNGTEKDEVDIIVRTQNDVEQQEDFHFDLSDSDDEDLGGESILLRTESFITEDDPYRFFDPHETSAIRSNTYQASGISASTNDDLRDVIDLLKTDTEIDGASRRQTEMEMIRPLLETDHEVNKWKESSALHELWSDDLKALYAVDVEVDRAKTRNTSKQAETGGSSDIVKAEQTDPDVNSSQDEVKEAIARQIPNFSQPFCPTTPEPKSRNVNASSAEPPPQLEAQQEEQSLKKQAIVPKRSIFTRKEKNSAMNAQRGATMMPGTTTVITKGGEMIDDIPIGKLKVPDI